jgi:hypothetical protein
MKTASVVAIEAEEAEEAKVVVGFVVGGREEVGMFGVVGGVLVGGTEELEPDKKIKVNMKNNPLISQCHFSYNFFNYHFIQLFLL